MGRDVKNGSDARTECHDADSDSGTATRRVIDCAARYVCERHTHSIGPNRNRESHHVLIAICSTIVTAAQRQSHVGPIRPTSWNPHVVKAIVANTVCDR